MKFKTYTKYKDSEIQWVGQIPVDWKINKVKHLVDKSVYYPIGDGDHGQITPDMYQDEGVPYIRVQNLSWNGEILYKGMVYISKEINLANKKSILKPQDLLIAKTGATIGKIGLIPKDINPANTTSSVGKITINKKFHSPFFWNYYFQSNIFQNQIFISAYQKSAQPGFNIEDLIDFVVIIPSLKEQSIIANFLDKKTAEIEELIEKDRKLIELLKEKRTALINHAVTKGLDQNVKMKDSGIEWIGEIPEDWGILRLRYLLKNGIEGIKIGPFGSMLKSDEITNNGYKVYGQENVINRNFNKGSRYINEDKFKQLIGYQIHPGDLIITMMGTIGKAQIIPTIIDEGIMDSHLIRLRFNGKVETKFIEILINSSNYIKGEIKYFSKGSIMEGLNSGIIKDLLLCIPQKIEQTKIIQFVNRKVTKIDKTIQKIEEKIKFLEEYKKSLIHHAVTGKIDVRGSEI